MSTRNPWTLEFLNPLLGAVLVVWIARAALAGVAAHRAPAEGRTSMGEVRDVPLAGVRARAADGSLRPIAGPDGRALVLVYDPECGPCALNMWNWIDLARDLPPSARIVALTVEGMEEVDGYWAGMERRVERLVVDTATMRDVLRVPQTPTTLLVRGGRVVREYAGPLNAVARREVMAGMEGPPSEP